MKNLLCLVYILIFLPLSALKPPELTNASTKKKAEEILHSHIQFKEFSREVASRTLICFIEELDPSKTYFLKPEISRYLEPNPQLVDRVIADFKRHNFNLFEEIYTVFTQAIKRRERLEERLTTLPASSSMTAKEIKSIEWAPTEAVLLEKLIAIRSIQFEAVSHLSEEAKNTMILRLQKKRALYESDISSSDKEVCHRFMLSYFLKALSSSLDAHTAYFTPTEASHFLVQVQQKLVGIGAELRDDLSGLSFVRLIEGGPAIRSGLVMVGDKIIAVNKEPIIGYDIVEAIDLIRGNKGSPVVLTLVREIQEDNQIVSKTFDVELIRDEIVLTESRYQAEAIPSGDGVIAHLHLFNFYQDSPTSSSAHDLTKAFEEIQSASKGKVKAVILDLRNNSGGLLNQAVAVTGLFIQKGIVVSVKDSSGETHHLRNLQDTPMWDGPLVVLTNVASASAAEIVAQTLQDYGRALLVGDSRTFGKGSYQVFTIDSNKKINDQGEYKVTLGLYYTVSGKSPQLLGACADIPIPGELSEFEIGEIYSRFPLDNGSIDPHFEDTFSDVHPFSRPRMMRLFSSGVQKKLTFLDPYKETLKAQSFKRQKENVEYQQLLTELKKEEKDMERLMKLSELQLKEATAIAEDLIEVFPKKDSFALSSSK